MSRQSEVTLWLRIKQQGAEAIGEISKSLKEFGNSFFELKNIAMEAAAFMLEQFGEKLVKAFAESEQGIIKLNAALRVSGRYSDEGTDKIQEMAETMSHLTDVSKDAAIGISATMAQYTRTLSTDQIANLQKAVIGLHALTGQDVEGAAQRIARALEGFGGSLKRLGVEVDNTMTEQQRYQVIMDKLGPSFKVAEEMNNSLMGQMTQFHHAVEELEKALGLVIVRSLNLGTTGKGLTGTVEGWTKSINESINVWTHWGQITFAVIRSVGQFIIFLGEELYDFGKIAYQVLKGVLLTQWDLAKGFYESLLAIVAAFELTWAEIKDKSQDFYNWMVDNVVNKIIEKFNEFSPIKLPMLEHLESDTKTAVAGAQQAFDDAKQGFLGAFQDIGDSWKGVWQSITGTYAQMNRNADTLFKTYQRIVDLWNAPLKPNAALGANTHAGGGDNLSGPLGEDPLTAMRNLEQRLKEVKQAFSENSVGVSAFIADLDELGPKIAEVEASLNGKDLVSFRGTISELNQELHKPGYTYENGSVRMLTVTEAIRYKLADVIKAAGTLNTVIANMAYDTFKGFFTAIQQAFQALIDGSKSAGQAFASALLSSLAQVAQGFGEFFLGRAAGAIAESLLPSNVVTGLSAGGAAAAAKFTAAAAAMFALSGILGGLAQRSSASSGSGGSASQAQQQTSQVNNNQQPGTIIIEGGLLDMSDPRQADALADAINTLKDRRIIIQAG